MALTRYRHFWSAKILAAPVLSTGGTDLGNPVTPPVVPGEPPPEPAVPVGQPIQDVDITGILKSYSPPRFVRQIRQVETGKYLNERILGRLQPEETNFSIVMASDFEALYAYNQDYVFEIIEELHSNQGGGVRYVADVATGTLFDREWAAYAQNGQDRDITLRFILKAYSRSFMNMTTLPPTPQGDPALTVTHGVTPVISMTAGTATGSATFRVRGDNPATTAINEKRVELVSMFAPNRAPKTTPPQPRNPFTPTPGNMN